jgi:hypothetical protein
MRVEASKTQIVRKYDLIRCLQPRRAIVAKLVQKKDIARMFEYLSGVLIQPSFSGKVY